MFLYELALQLDVRSTELVDQARASGMDVGPSSFLTPEQIQHLRSGVAPSAGSATAPLVAGQLVGPGPGPGAPPPPAGAPDAMPPWGTAPPPPGPPAVSGPPAGSPTGGDGHLSPARVAVYIAVPIAVLLAVFAFVSSGRGDGGGSPSSDGSAGPAGIFGPDDGMTPVGDAAEVTEVGRYCEGWSSIDDMPDSSAPADYEEAHAVTLELFPDLILALTTMAEGSTGALAETALGARDDLRAAVLLHRELPADEASLTAEQRAELRRLDGVPTQDFEYLRFIAQKRCG